LTDGRCHNPGCDSLKLYSLRLLGPRQQSNPVKAGLAYIHMPCGKCKNLMKFVWTLGCTDTKFQANFTWIRDTGQDAYQVFAFGSQNALNRGVYRATWSIFAVARSSVVCRSSATLVRPTHSVEIFGNISTAFGTLAILWHPQKIPRRSSQGTSVCGAKHEGYSQIKRFWTHRRKRYKIGSKLVLITNRKSHMSFRLVPKSVTLKDLERPLFCVIFR